jgi:methylamine dehydrogenase accessory protein MauD
MEVGLIAARLLLAAVFLIAGLAKLMDRSGLRQTLIDFGVPVLLVSPLGVLLPLGELAIALALLPAATARYGAVGALGLLVLFTAAISLALLRGKSPACRCFGEVSVAPVGAHTLFRNAVLLGLAAFVLVFGNRAPSILAPLAAFSVTDWLALSATLSVLLAGGALVLLLIQILQQQGRVLLRLETLETALLGNESPRALSGSVPGVPVASGLPVGTTAPRFLAEDLEGVPVKLDDLLALRKPVLLLFVHPRCEPCDALMPEIAVWQRAHGEVLTIPVISEGEIEENRKKLAQHGLDSMLLRQRGNEIARQYQAYGTPSAVLIRVDGTIGHPVAGGADAIRRLLATALDAAMTGTVRALQPGEMAPAWVLEDLKGRLVALQDFQGAETLLVFWNPTCGFCQQMLADLQAWDANPPPGAPELVVISRGTVEENRKLNLRSTVVLDNYFRIGSAFGAAGTPMAVLVDAAGRVASRVAAGAAAVFALAAPGNGKLISIQPAKADQNGDWMHAVR